MTTTKRSTNPTVLYGQTIPTRAHHNHEQIARKRQYARRRVAVAAAGLALGAGVMTGGSKVIEALNPENTYLVDRDKVVAMDPEERAEKYDVVTVGPDDNLTSMAEEYVKQHGGDTGDLLESFIVQARGIDADAERAMNAEVVQPDEEYFVPRG